MDKVSSAKARVISAEIQKEVNAILAKHGLQQTKTKSTYGDLYSFKVEAHTVTLNDKGVNLDTREAQAFLELSGILGITEPEKDLGAEVIIRGKRLQVVGYNSRKNNSVLVKDKKTGDEYWASNEVLNQLPSYKAPSLDYTEFKVR